MIIIISLVFILRSTLGQTYVPCDKYPAIVEEAQYRFPNKDCSLQSDPDAMTLAATYGDPISFGFVNIMLFANGCHFSCSKCTLQNQADQCMQGCASPTRESHNDIEEVIYEMIPFTCPCISGYEEQVPETSDCTPLCQLPCQTCVMGSGVNCQTCSDPSTMIVQNTKCICMTNYFMLNNACVSYDVATCTECVQSPACLAYTKRDASCICIQQYYEVGTLICKKCHSSCRTCDNDTSCLTCQPDTNRDIVVYPHTCLCSDGYSEDLAGDSCQTCEPTCQSCAKSNYKECTTCNASQYRELISKNCKCMSGYYNVQGQLTCSKCYFTCHECFGPQYYQCSGCGDISITHRYLHPRLQCICQNYYGSINGQEACEPCNARCNLCSWVDYCLSCKAAQFRVLSGVTCVCSTGYYQNGTNDICDACHYSCNTCTGPQINQCLTCNSTKLRKYDNAGGCPCQLSHIDVGVSTCAKCYYECLTCDSVNANSCLSCPTTRKEVPSELPGHYYCKCELSNSTDVGSYQLCKLCHYSCATCSDVYNFNCLTCNSRTLYLGKCVCQSNQYDDGVNDICPQCHQTCLTCSNSTNTSCLTCSALEYRIISDTTCECIPGYVLDTTTLECLKCDYRCERCINNIYHCTTCPVGSLRSLNTTNNVCECQADAPNDKPGEPICQPCHYSCSNCTTENASDCTTCNQSIQRYFDNGYCYCLSHYYDDGSKEECKICSQYCVNCITTSNNCTSCDDAMNRVLVGNECQCKVRSPTQLISYYDDLNAICPQCHFTCLTCSGSQYYNCLTCYANDFRVLSGTECICKPRYVESGASKCNSCNYTCDECVDSKFKCITCPTNTFRVFDEIRYTCNCDSGYFDNGIQDCQLCNSNCKTCAQQSTTCTSCKPDEFRKLVNSSCICIDTYYDVGSGSCVQCHHSCQTCIGPADFNCTLCPEYSVSKRIMSSSQCNCVGGYYDDGTQFCQLCITICQTCLASASNCSSCVPGQLRILKSGNCVCIDGYYSSGQLTCVSCSPYCKTCQNQAQTCYSCPDGSKRLLNSTTNECLCKPGTTDVGGVNCQDCHYTCGTCTNTVTTCSTCPDFSMRQLTTSYTCPCINGAYDDGVAVCKQCDSTCATCINSAFNCVTCDAAQNRIKAGSQCECKNGYWEELPTKICKLCDFSCLTCFGSATQCLTCDANLNRMLVGQSCLCQSDKYLNVATQTCDACGVKCAQCSVTATSCDSCLTSRYLSGNQCLCDPGYYDTGLAMCAECAFKCKTYVTTATNCLSCQTNANRYQLGNDCPCQIKYYQQGSGNIRNCDLCHYSCAECITSQDKCTACTTDSVVNRSAVSNNKCLCKPGYFDDGTINCKQCHYTCLTCITIATKCTSCEISVSFRQDLSISSYSCPCKSTFYDNGLAACQKCSVKCVICQGNKDNCTLCNSNAGNFRVNIIPDCPCQTGYYDDGNTLQCHKCHARCASCTIHASCILCAGLNRLPAPTCDCLDGFYEDTVTYSCKSCDFRCATCLIAGTCLTCRGDRIGIDCDCPIGYYDGGVQLCKQCLPKCKSCILSLGNCLECTGIRVKPYQCLCPDHYYDNEVQVDCIECDYTCGNCDKLGCTTCAGNRELKSQKCNCPSGGVSYNTTPYCSSCEVAVIVVQFLADASGFSVLFDFPLPQFQSTILDTDRCLQILNKQTYNTIGRQPTCYIDKVNAKLLIVKFGENAQLNEGDEVLIQPNQLKHFNCVKGLSTFIFTKVMRPPNIQSPLVILKGPEFPISPCDIITVSFQKQLYDGSRAFKLIKWELQSVITPIVIQTIQEANANQQQSIIFPPTSLPNNTNITLTCHYTNFLNLKNRTQFVIQTQGVQSPYLIFEEPTSGYYLWQPIEITLSYKNIICPNQVVQASGASLIIKFEENQFARNPQYGTNITLSQSVFPISTEYGQIILTIPAYFLSSAVNYQLMAIGTNQLTNISSTTYIDFIIQNSALLAQIVGGTRIQNYRKDYMVQAQARDPDTNMTWNEDPNIKVIMECIDIAANTKCMNSTMHVIHINPTSKTQYVKGEGLYPFTVQKWQATFTKDVRTVIAEAMIVLLEADIPQLDYSYPNGWLVRRININEKLEVMINQNETQRFSEMEYSVALIYEYQTVGIIYFKSNQLRFQIWDKFQSFDTTNKLTLSIQAHDLKYMMPAVGTITVYVNTPPVDAILSISPTTGSSLQTSFVISINGATDADTPLSYKLSYYLTSDDQQQDILEGSTDRLYDLFQYQRTKLFKTILPSGVNGTIVLVAQISDSLGSVSNCTQIISMQSLYQTMHTQNETCQFVIDVISKIEANMNNQAMIAQELSSLYKQVNSECKQLLVPILTSMQLNVMKGFLTDGLSATFQQQLGYAMESLENLRLTNRSVEAGQVKICAIMNTTNMVELTTSQTIQTNSSRLVNETSESNSTKLQVTQIAPVMEQLNQLQSIISKYITEQSELLQQIDAYVDIGAEQQQRNYIQNGNIRKSCLSVVSILQYEAITAAQSNLTQFNQTQVIIRQMILNLVDSFAVNMITNTRPLLIEKLQFGINVKKLSQREFDKIVQKYIPYRPNEHDKDTELILPVNHHIVVKIINYFYDPYSQQVNTTITINSTTTDDKYYNNTSIQPLSNRNVFDPTIVQTVGHSNIQIPHIYNRKHALNMYPFISFCDSEQAQLYNKSDNITISLVCGQYKDNKLQQSCKLVQIMENSTGYQTQCSCIDLLPTSVFVKRQQLLHKSELANTTIEEPYEELTSGNVLENPVIYVEIIITLCMIGLIYYLQLKDTNYQVLSQMQSQVQSEPEVKLKQVPIYIPVNFTIVKANFTKLHEITSLIQVYSPQLSRTYRSLLLLQHIFYLIAFTHITNYYLPIYASVILSLIGAIITQSITKMLEGFYMINIKSIRRAALCFQFIVMFACVTPTITLSNLSTEQNILWGICFTIVVLVEFTLVEFLIITVKLKGYQSLNAEIEGNNFDPVVHFQYYFVQNWIVAQIFKDLSQS